MNNLRKSFYKKKLVEILQAYDELASLEIDEAIFCRQGLKTKFIMKKLYLFSIAIGLIIVLFSFNSCKKKVTSPICSTNRQIFRNLVNKKGVVFYYKQYNKFAVSIDTLINSNIDTQINGLPCELPKQFQIDGARIIINGKLEKFNDGENFGPTLGGEELYFLKIDQITSP